MSDCGKSEKSNSEATFFKKVNNESRIFSNIGFIVDKLENDGFLNNLKSCYSLILDREVSFALEELTKVQRLGRGTDLKSQLTNNTYIFKENLKTISSIIGFFKS